MSDKNIISTNKDSTANNSQDNGKQNNPSSPKGSYSTNFLSFTSTEINQRNFPSKANYFGQNTTNRGNNSHKRNMSPENQSPVLNYYASLSPKFSKGNINQYYSPEQSFGKENIKHSQKQRSGGVSV